MDPEAGEKPMAPRKPRDDLDWTKDNGGSLGVYAICMAMLFLGTLKIAFFPAGRQRQQPLPARRAHERSTFGTRIEAKLRRLRVAIDTRAATKESDVRQRAEHRDSKEWVAVHVCAAWPSVHSRDDVVHAERNLGADEHDDGPLQRVRLFVLQHIHVEAKLR
jgi:hypothetical protein